MPEILNKSGQLNYITGNKVFLLDEFKRQTTAELLGNLANMIDELPWGPVFTETPLFTESAKLENPYNLPKQYPPVVDIYINSPGGCNTILTSITSLLNLARAKGAIIRTNVIGQAASCASILAVQGTPHFRIMYDASCHMIHFGQSRMVAERNNEIEYAAQNAKRTREKIRQIYFNNTRINQKALQKYYEIEGSGTLTAQECLKHGVCDWIVSPRGIFVKSKNLSR